MIKKVPNATPSIEKASKGCGKASTSLFTAKGKKSTILKKSIVG